MRIPVLNRLVDISYALLPESHGDDLCRARHFAYLLDKTRVIGIGWNKAKNHPWLRKFNYPSICNSIHAELNVLSRNRNNCYGKDMVVLRINRNNKLDMSRPCIGCMSAIKIMGIRSVCYTNEDGQWQSINLNERRK